MSSLISLAELEAQPKAFTIVDVRLAEDYQDGHIPGALNHCVFEVVFLERLRQAIPDPTTPLVVYGASAQSHEARMAVEKLERAGYTAVQEFRPGWAGWPGQPPSAPTPASAPPLNGRHLINLEESRIEWTGRNLLNKHYGSLHFASGYLDFQDGRLTGGNFAFDLASLTCHDLKDSPLHPVLLHHLWDHDFLDVEHHPTAGYTITSAEIHSHLPPGSPNLSIQGELSLKGITRPLALSAVAGLSSEGKPAAQATVQFDRTEWNILYGSGKFFHRLGGHLVNDLIEIQVKIITA